MVRKTQHLHLSRQSQQVPVRYHCSFEGHSDIAWLLLPLSGQAAVLEIVIIGHLSHNLGLMYQQTYRKRALVVSDRTERVLLR